MIAAIQPENETILDIINLKTYFFLEGGTVRAVDGVDLSLRGRQTLGVVGESGCGKSITAMSVMRLIPFLPARSSMDRSTYTPRRARGLTSPTSMLRAPRCAASAGRRSRWSFRNR